MRKKKNQTTSAAQKPISKGLQTKHVVLILGSLVIIAVTIIAVIILTRKPEAVSGNHVPIGGTPVINQDNVVDIMEGITERVARGMFHTHMNTTWRFPDGKSPSSDAVMGNSARNNFPMWFEVTINDTGEVIYTSDLLPLGSQVKEVRLNRELESGTYPATIHIHMVDEDGSPVESNMGFSINLIIQN